MNRVLAVLVLLVWSGGAPALDVSDRYRSPRSSERKVRPSTELIVLHTTEAPARSSLNKLCDRGEAHYCVTEDGTVYRIVDRDREAFHAGRSMWNGKEDVDKFSVGIECVGYHDKEMGLVQIRAVRDLVKELQKMYKIPDERVVCHSHVAYGAPNRWQKKNHRGRKRCGMLFAMPSVRAQLGLSSRPSSDADVRARRLVVGDDYLNRVLYGSVDTMKGKYPAVAQESPKPQSSGGFFSWLGFGGSSSPPKQPKAVIKARPSPKKASAKAASPKKASAKAASAKKAAAKSASAAPPKSVAELKSRGFVLKGVVSAGVTASQIAGGRWNSPDTYYTIRDKVIPGSRIDPSHIEKGMSVWMRKR